MSQPLDTHQLATSLRNRALDLGFDLVGIAPAKPSAYRDYLRNWLDTGQAGTMHWLTTRFNERTDPATYFPARRSVLCVAMNYHVPLEPPASPTPGRVARYALGDDYHDLIKQKLHTLADHLRSLAPHAQTRAAVDTAPLMEKELAQLAGLGWVGKNTCLINPRIGSWTLLGEIVTTLDLPCDQPALDHCGTCRRCIEACPTQAITAPYQLDARKCISYLTIEHRDAIPPDLQPLIGDWLYGCDICQDVCPFNTRAPLATSPEFHPRFPSATLDTHQILDWKPEDYQRTLKGSAIKRVKLPLLQRNAKIVSQNLSKQ